MDQEWTRQSPDWQYKWGGRGKPRLSQLMRFVKLCFPFTQNVLHSRVPLERDMRLWKPCKWKERTPPPPNLSTHRASKALYTLLMSCPHEGCPISRGYQAQAASGVGGKGNFCPQSGTFGAIIFMTQVILGLGEEDWWLIRLFWVGDSLSPVIPGTNLVFKAAQVLQNAFKVISEVRNNKSSFSLNWDCLFNR